MGSISRYRESKTPQPAVHVGRYRRWNVSTGQVTSDQSFSVNPQTTEPLFLRRCWDETHPGPPYKIGGPFTLVKSSRPIYQVKGEGYWTRPPFLGYQSEYKGGFTPLSFPWGAYTQTQYNNIGLAAPLSDSWLDSSPYGASAFDKARPQIEKVDLGVTLGEIGELPRMLKTTASGFRDIYRQMGGDQKSLAMTTKRVADNFLNDQFGWAPFVGDMAKAYDVYQNSDQYASQLERDHGRNVKRKRIVSMTESSDRLHREYAPWVYPYSPLTGLFVGRQVDGVGCNGFVDVIKELRTLVWFTATFTHYSPAFSPNRKYRGSNYDKVIQLMKLYGIRVSPSVIWDLTPWSWLADWFGEFGDAIERFEDWAIDGTVAKRAYVMKHTIDVTTYNHTLFLYGGDVHLSWTCLAEAKDRKSAKSPYGFDLPPENLSVRQLAILAALGISKAL